MSKKKAYLIIFIVLLIDQASKIYMKLNFHLEERIHVTDWFKIHFTENPGMAWGTVIPGEYGKLALTLFRLVAILGIGYWLWDIIKKKTPAIYTFCVSLIFAGALGNILDSVFYGIFFSESTPRTIATAFPEDGYAPVFYGKVVDMLYFPLYDGAWPSWVPIVGGEHFTFFNAIFNIADASISIGVILLLIFSSKAFPKEKPAPTTPLDTKELV